MVDGALMQLRKCAAALLAAADVEAPGALMAAMVIAGGLVRATLLLLPLGAEKAGLDLQSAGEGEARSRLAAESWTAAA